MSDYKYKPGPPWTRSTKVKVTRQGEGTYRITKIDKEKGMVTIDWVSTPKEEKAPEMPKKLDVIKGSEVKQGMLLKRYKMHEDGGWAHWGLKIGNDLVAASVQTQYPHYIIEVEYDNPFPPSPPEWGETAY